MAQESVQSHTSAGVGGGDASRDGGELARIGAPPHFGEPHIPGGPVHLHLAASTRHLVTKGLRAEAHTRSKAVC